MHQGQPGPPLQGYGYGPAIPPGSYYGPGPNPPPQRNRLGTLRIIIRAFIAGCVLLGIAALILWLIYRPTRMQVVVETAALSNFNLTSTNPPVLSFKLSTRLSIRNPNRKVSFYYDWLQANGFYQGKRFGWAALPTFSQGVLETTTLQPELQGRSSVDITVSGVDGYKSDNSTGVFDVDVWLFGGVRYKLGAVTTRQYQLRVGCPLHLQLMVPSMRTNCVVVRF